MRLNIVAMEPCSGTVLVPCPIPFFFPPSLYVSFRNPTCTVHKFVPSVISANLASDKQLPYSAWQKCPRVLTVHCILAVLNAG